MNVTITDYIKDVITITNAPDGSFSDPQNIPRPLNGSNQLSILVDAEAACSIKLEWSADGSDWFQETVETVSSTEITHTTVVRVVPSGNSIISVPIMANYVRLSAAGDGSTPDLTLTTLTGIR